MKPKPDEYGGFIDLIHEHQAVLHRLCWVYAAGPQDREDLYQEMLLQAWRSFGSFRAEAEFSTWLYRVALNTALLRRRKESRRREIVVDVPAVAEPAAEDQAPHEADVELLHACIRELPELDRAILLLHLERNTYEQIAEIVGLTRSNVSVRLVRVKGHLRKLMMAKGYEEDRTP